jgi:serine/threonine protein kinase
MQRIQSNMSDDRTQMGPGSKPQTSDADQPTRMDSKAITMPTTMPGWTFGIGSTQLGAGTRLFEYEVTGVIGQGGFGIVYRALDRVLNRSVAIKEYLPATMALRSDTGGVTLASQAHVNAFEAGLSSFVNEARLLAQFDHPALVKVFRFWEANGTAYMVMPLYEGVTLKQYLHEHPGVSQRVLESLIEPLLDALTTLHDANVFHRDIAPDNILILKDGRPLLLDFGAARQRIGEMTQGMTVIVKPGFAPIEQYAGDASTRQGAWTDIYALAAVMYYAITGKVPPPSVSRVVEDTFEPLAQLRPAGFSMPFLEALDRGLRVDHKQRPQSIVEFRALLRAGRGSKPPGDDNKRTHSSSSYVTYAAMALVVLLLGAIGLRIAHKPTSESVNTNTVQPPVETHAQPPPVVSPPTVVTPPPAVKAPPVQPRASFSPAGALHEVATSGSSAMAPIVTVRRPRAVADRDKVEFSVTAPVGGYVYVLMHDTDGKLYLLFPNNIDRDNRIPPNVSMQLPRSNWSIVATPPLGVNRLLAIVSETPRDFDAIGLVPAGDFGEIKRESAAHLYASHQEPWPFLSGRPVCSQPCTGAFGAAEFTVEVVKK